MYLSNWNKKTQTQIDAICLKEKGDVVGYTAGGFSSLLLTKTSLKVMNVVAIADKNTSLHGKSFLGKPVISPNDIPLYSNKVLILSKAFGNEIFEQLSIKFGDSLIVYNPFNSN